MLATECISVCFNQIRRKWLEALILRFVYSMAVVSHLQLVRRQGVALVLPPLGSRPSPFVDLCLGLPVFLFRPFHSFVPEVGHGGRLVVLPGGPQCLPRLDDQLPVMAVWEPHLMKVRVGRRP